MRMSKNAGQWCSNLACSCTSLCQSFSRFSSSLSLSTFCSPVWSSRLGLGFECTGILYLSLFFVSTPESYEKCSFLMPTISTDAPTTSPTFLYLIRFTSTLLGLAMMIVRAWPRKRAWCSQPLYIHECCQRLYGNYLCYACCLCADYTLSHIHPMSNYFSGNRNVSRLSPCDRHQKCQVSINNFADIRRFFSVSLFSLCTIRNFTNSERLETRFLSVGWIYFMHFPTMIVSNNTGTINLSATQNVSQVRDSTIRRWRVTVPDMTSFVSDAPPTSGISRSWI